MNYIEIKRFEMVKGTGRAFAESFSKNLKIRNVPGFKHLHVGFSDSSHQFDNVEIMFVWENETVFQDFKRSDFHLELHRKRKPNPNILKQSSYRYHVIYED